MTIHHHHLSHPKYRPDIDGLRALAVLPVVAFHAFPDLMKGGFIGVDVFFVISGFLISTIIYENLDRGTFSFPEFYARRIKRIFPALFLVLIASYTFGWFVLNAEEYEQLGKHIAAGVGFVSNFVLWGEAGYFDNSAETKPLLHLWSLGIEEQFYIVWPLLLWFSWKRKFSLLSITIVVTIASFYLNLTGIVKDDVATFYSPQTRFWELFCGGLLAWATLYQKDTFATLKVKLDGWLTSTLYGDKAKAEGETLANVLSVAGLLLLAFGFWGITEDLSFPGKWAVVPVLGAVLIISAGPGAWINRTVLSHKVAVWFGLISYPLYLWHWPLLSFAHIVEGTPGRNIRVGAIALSIVLAWLTYRLVERPVRLGKHIKAKVFVLVLLMSVVGLVGYDTYSNDGYKFRAAESSPKAQRSRLIGEASDLRRVGVRAGICHFNEGGQFTDIDSFIANWKCTSPDEGLLDSRLMVFGDSHGADKAMALRSNGVGVVQITGAGCQLTPKSVSTTRNYCKKLFQLAEANRNNTDAVLVAGRYDMNELSDEYINEILAYWGSWNRPVYLFTPMPNFKLQMIEYKKYGTTTKKPSLAAEKKFLSILSGKPLPANIKVIRTSQLWCENSSPGPEKPCAVEANGKIMMIGGGHLSAEGAKAFGKQILSDHGIGVVSKN